MQGDFHTYDIRFGKMDGSKSSFSVRNPSWGENIEIHLNGKKVGHQSKDGFLVVENKLSAGDHVQIRVKFQINIITEGNRFIKLADVRQPVTGALCHGPYVMGVDTSADIVFTTAPTENVVFAGTIASGAGNRALAGIRARSFAGDAYLTANYKHAWFPSYSQTVFRPVSELTFLKNPYMMLSTIFASESLEQFKSFDKNSLVPWEEL